MMAKSDFQRVCWILAMGLTAACSKKEAPPPSSDAVQAPADTAAAPVLDAKQLYSARCTVCHGASGKGDGPGAAALQPKPRDYTDATWQKSVTDEELKKVIVQGGAAVGKSPIMPANPDLESEPQVVQDLVAIIRSYANK